MKEKYSIELKKEHLNPHAGVEDCTGARAFKDVTKQIVEWGATGGFILKRPEAPNIWYNSYIDGELANMMDLREQDIGREIVFEKVK